MVSQLWILSTRPAFLVWAAVWIAVCSVDDHASSVANMFTFFALLLGMMVGHAMNEIRNAPVSWQLPKQQRTLVAFFLLHSVIWTIVGTFFADEVTLESYGVVPVWMLIYFWFVLGTTVRHSPSLLAPTSFVIWFVYIGLAMWPHSTLEVATSHSILAIVVWFVVIGGVMYWLLRRETHRVVLDGPFVSFFNSFDEKQVKKFREELVTKRAAGSSMWTLNLSGAGFFTWLRAVFYENLGFFNLRSLLLNLLLVIGALVMVSSMMAVPGLNGEIFSHFALFWMCMILAMEYPLNLSPNLLYPFNRKWRGLLSFSLRFSQVLIGSLIYLFLALLSQLIPPFDLKMEGGVAIQWITLDSPMVGVLLNFTLMPIYYMLVLLTRKCLHAFVAMMFLSGFVFGYLAESENAAFLDWLYQNHCLSMMAILMILLWVASHLYLYRVRDIST